MAYKNIEDIKKYNKKYYQQNKKKILQQKKEYHQINRERNLEKMKEHHLKNREKEIKRIHIYWQINKEKLNQQRRENYKQNKEGIRNKVKEHRKKHPKKYRARDRARKIPLDTNCLFCHTEDNLIKHHPNYNDPLRINTLCKQCHPNLHNHMKVGWS